MKKIRVWIEFGCVNPTAEEIIEVPDDATEKQIEEEAKAAADDYLNWGWEVAEDG